MREICSGVGGGEKDMGDEENSSGTTQTGTFLNTPRTQCADLPCLGESP